MPNALKLTEQKFGRLLAIRRTGTTRHGAALWLVRCECGTEFETKGCDLRRGNTTSCGCSRATHGQSRTGLYRLWSTMIARCHRPSATSYAQYGGRGIEVCLRWRESFEMFATDMGPRPSPRHTLDRFPNQSGNYAPGNVRWATWDEQANNKSNNHMLTVGGVTATLAEWSQMTSIGYTTIKERLRRGWSPSRAVTAPTRRGTTRGHASE